MASTARSMGQIIREAMDHYWSVIYSKTDEGLTASEKEWKRGHARDMARWDKKFGPQYEQFFKSTRKG